jgi:hypothetical protein
LNLALPLEHASCARDFERLARWLIENKARYEQVRVMNTTLLGVIGDLDKKDWREIVGRPYDKGAQGEITAEEKADIMIQLH